jgi:hypothetical protein
VTRPFVGGDPQTPAAGALADPARGATLTAADIKKALKEAGLEVYRTRGEVVYLADRVRENLLMDASTFVRAGALPLAVGFVVRAQRTDFPNEGEDHLFDRARSVATSARDRGFRESTAEVRKVLDPGDAQRTLDTWCEISFEKEVQDLDAAIVEARFALGLEKAAAPQRGS